jgi:hypothetical protein
MTTTAPPTADSVQPRGCGALIALAALLGLALAVPLIVQFGVVNVAWYGDISKLQWSTRQIMLFSFLHPLALVPLALGFLSRNGAIRAITQTLLAATLCALLLLIPRALLDPAAVYAAALARLAITALFALPLVALAWRRGARFGLGGAGLALLCAALFALPWVRLGALGDWVDTLLALAQGLAIGLLGIGLLGGLLLPGMRGAGNGWALAAGGMTMAAALVGIGGAFGQDDIQALMMPALGAAAFAATGLALPDRLGRVNLLGALIVIGAAAALPLAFADPEEIALVVALSDDTAKFTERAASQMVLVGLLLWLLFQLRARALPAALPGAVAAGLGALALVGVGALYATSGQAGMYGNHFFVIMKQQADLGQATSIADLAERRRFVYTTLVAQADQSQAELRQLLDRRGVRYTPFYLVNAIEVDGDVLLRQQIAGRPDVERVIFSQALRPLPEPLPLEPGSEAAPAGPAWNISAIGADRVWSELGVRGDGIVVGQSDSGADWQHPAIHDAYRGRAGDHNYNWYDPWTGRQEPWDGNGHGTHTISTVLGAGGIGVAPGAQWFGCANLVRNVGNPPDYLRCMQFMLAPFPLGGDALRDGDPARAADVSTNSWGCPPIEGCDDTALSPAIAALRAAGIFFVAAAGNEGPACGSLETSPGDDPGAISVGAIDFSGDLASFSNRGAPGANGHRAAPTILAPGVDVLAAWPGGGYATNSGTSMAAPHVAGVVALMWSANPALRGNVDATEQLLIDSASPYTGALVGCGSPDLVPSPESGYGVVNAYRAVQMAQTWRK